MALMLQSPHAYVPRDTLNQYLQESNDPQSRFLSNRVEDVIPKSMYKGMDMDNKQATVMNILVAHANMDDKTAYNIVKTIFDKRTDLIAVHKEAENFKLESQKASATPIPFHPGALKYFAEKGIKVN